MTKTAIIGAGAIAYCHAAALKELGVEVFGVLDANVKAAQKLADEYGAQVIENLPDAVKKVNMVHICTPPSFRVPYAKIAMEAGCHIVMEKPMAITVSDAETLVGMARQNDVKLMVDFNHRFRRGFQELLDAVTSGALGRVVNVHFTRMGMLGGHAGTANDTWRRKPDTVCGMSIESLSHDIDMMFQLAGPITGVKANVRGTFEDVPQFDNNVSALFDMKGGAIGSISASWSSHLKWSARSVVGTEGTAILEGGDTFDFDRLRIKTKTMSKEKVIELNDKHTFMTCPSYFNANKHFLDCVERNVEADTSGRHALETLKVSHAILNSAKTQTTVAL